MDPHEQPRSATRAAVAHSPRVERAAQPSGGLRQVTGTLTQITGTLQALGNSATVVVAQGLSKFSTFAAFLLVSLVLPTADFGQFALALTLGALFGALASFGLDSVLARMLAQTNLRSERKRLLHDALQLKLGASLLAVVLAIVAMILTHATLKLTEGVALAMADIVLSNVGATLAAYYQARLEGRTTVLAQGGAQAVYLVLLAICAVLRVDWLLMLDALVLSDAVLCLTLALRLRRHIAHSPLASVVRRRVLLREAIPLGIVSAGVLLYTRLDTVLLAHFLGLAAVAAYSVAAKLTETPLLVATAIASSALPIISAWNAQVHEARGRERVLAAARTALRYSYAFTMLAAVFLTFFGGALVTALYGTRYASSAPAIAVLVWGTVAMASNIVTAAVLIALGRQRWLAPLVAANLTLNVALNLWAIPHWGYFGCAVATTGTEGFNALVQIVLLCRALAAPRLLYSTSLAAATGATSLALFFASGARPTPLLGVTAVLAVIGAILAFRLVTRDDLGRVQRAIARRRGVPAPVRPAPARTRGAY